MKKHILFASLFCTVSMLGFSQNLSLIYDGNPVPNNGVVTFTGEPSTPTIYAYMGVTNNGSSTLTVKCKKEELSLVANSINTFCWDACYPPDVYVSVGSLDITPGETNTAFIGEYQPVNTAGQSAIRYTYFDMNNPTDSVCFIAHYNAYPLGVDGLRGGATLSNAFPNPAGDVAGFRYNVAGQTEALLLIRNVLGSTLAEEWLTGTGEVNIPVRDLAEGIYFYSLVVNGETQFTRKLIVSR